MKFSIKNLYFSIKSFIIISYIIVYENNVVDISFDGCYFII